jgi:hypothetical protein
MGKIVQLTLVFRKKQQSLTTPTLGYFIHISFAQCTIVWQLFSTEAVGTFLFKMQRLLIVYLISFILVK